MHVARAPVSALRWLRDHAWLVMAAACGLVLLNTIEFAPPAQVRTDDAAKTALVGEAPRQEFNDALSNPQAVQIRATLREYSESNVDASAPDPEVDALARVLSQPVVTTIFGLTANVDQTVHLDRERVRVDVAFEATPRLIRTHGKHEPPRLSLEHVLRVTATRETTFGGPERWTVVTARGVLIDLVGTPHRTTFSVDDHLFSLDVELNHSS